METKGFEFIRLWKNKVWSVHDLHRTAYKNLITNRSVTKKDDKPNATAQRMEDNLRRAGVDPKYKQEGYTVAADVNCFACHASLKEPPTKDAHKKWDADSFYTPAGVGCEMCHWHGSLYRDEHQKNEICKSETVPGATLVVAWRE